MGFLNFLFWATVLYYVLSYVLFVCLMLAFTGMYRYEEAPIPWRYWKVVAIPYVGFWFLLVLLLGDLVRHMENEESRYREHGSEDGNDDSQKS